MVMFLCFFFIRIPAARKFVAFPEVEMDFLFLSSLDLIK